MAKTVFVVDDENDIRASVKQVLEQEGYRVQTMRNGEEFLKSVQKAKPDLVLLDIMMPGLSTKDILSRLKHKGPGLKIIFLTVVRLSDEEKRELLALANVVDYITKPFDLNDLLLRIKNAI